MKTQEGTTEWTWWRREAITHGHYYVRHLQAAPPAATGLQPANGNAAANPAQARPPSATKPVCPACFVCDY